MRSALIVARREITEKLRSRAFWIMNAIIMGLIVLSIVLPAFLDDDAPAQVTIAAVGEQAESVLGIAQRQAPVFGVEVTVVTGGDEDAARAALASGEVDLVLVGTTTLIARRAPFGDDVELIDAARRLALLDDALAEAGVDAEGRAELLRPAPLEIETTEPQDEGPDESALAVGLATVGLLYGLLIFYGQQVAQGIVQEKQSRVIEVLLATMRPVDLLGGKLLGLGALGLLQVLGLGATGYVALVLSGRDAVPAQAVPTVVAALVWFLLGYALYASLFALAAAVVAKVEDLQTGMMGPIIVLIASFFLVQFVVAAPDGSIARVASFLPTSAPIAQPLLVAIGRASVWSTVGAAASVIATTAIVVPVAARVHAGGALAVRQRISIGEALRRSRA